MDQLEDAQCSVLIVKAQYGQEILTEWAGYVTLYTHMDSDQKLPPG